jgi:hypothetical protein
MPAKRDEYSDAVKPFPESISRALTPCVSPAATGYRIGKKKARNNSSAPLYGMFRRPMAMVFVCPPLTITGIDRSKTNPKNQVPKQIRGGTGENSTFSNRHCPVSGLITDFSPIGCLGISQFG